MNNPNESKSTIVIVGAGAFAEKFHQLLPQIFSHHSQNVELLSLKVVKNQKIDLILHVGSGRELKEALQLAAKWQCTFVQASTGVDTSFIQEVTFPYIEAPNLSLPIIKFLYMLEKFGKHFSCYQIAIEESHQHTKKTLPGTAISMAKSLGISPQEIKSIRDPAINYAHGFHQIQIKTEENVELQFSTKVIGRDTYVHGLFTIFHMRKKLEPKKYFITDLIDLNLI